MNLTDPTGHVAPNIGKHVTCTSEGANNGAGGGGGVNICTTGAGLPGGDAAPGGALNAKFSGQALTPEDLAAVKEATEGKAVLIAPEGKSPAQMTTVHFLAEELRGVYDTTVAPALSAIAHPVETAVGAATNFKEGVKDVVKDPKGTLTRAAGGAKEIGTQFGKEVASGNPRAIGQAGGLVIDTFIAVRAVQGKEIKLGDNLRIAPAGNRTGGVGELPHYHHRIVGPDGKTVPGGGIGWHRPWEP